MKVAVLTNEAYKGGTTLEESEHKLLASVLKLSRLEDDKARILLQAIEACTIPEFVRAYGGIYELFFTKILEGAGEHADAIKGVLYLRKSLDTRVQFLEEDDWSDSNLNCLESFITLFQRRGWMRDWFSPFFAIFAGEYPTPLQVIETLTEPAAHFEYDIEDARRMLKDWPELVQPETAKAQGAS